MRYVRISWTKLVASYLLLVAISVFSTAYITSRYMYQTSTDVFTGLQVLDDTVIGSRFTQDGHSLPKRFHKGSLLPWQATNENNQTILIRRPKGDDLDPQPLGWPVLQAATVLGLNEIPAHRPPQVILLGFGKCGTTALLEFLALHPKIVSPGWEVDFFCDRSYPRYDFKWYVRIMPPSLSDQITIEKSPCYIVEHDSHLRMYAMNSSLKVMVIIRDPITRLLSEYGHYFAYRSYWGLPKVSFVKRVYNSKRKRFRKNQILKVGSYYPHFEHLLKVFPRNQLLIVDGDKLVTDPLSQIRIVEDFLGLSHEITEQDIYFDTEKGFYCMILKKSNETKCMGESKGRQHVEIRPKFKKKLIKILRPYNEKFFKLVGQRFDWLH